MISAPAPTCVEPKHQNQPASRSIPARPGISFAAVHRGPPGDPRSSDADAHARSGQLPGREGDVPTHCTILMSGFAFRQKVTGAGSRQIIALCIPGDAIDFQNMFLDIKRSCRPDADPARWSPISARGAAGPDIPRPAIGAAVIHSTLIEASILREWVVNVGRRDARARIAHIFVSSPCASRHAASRRKTGSSCQ